MFGDLVDSPKFYELNNCLTLALGKDISGQLVFADLEKMPHLLIAGTTGSGKSVGINTIIMSILYRFRP
jgi:S-DNA-T family DNA segregation ATPase FtsK/SpoIIIE